MSFRTILVPVEQRDLMSSTLETALCLAKKFDSYIEGFALRVESPAAHAMGDAAAVMIPELEQDIAENAEQTRGLFGPRIRLMHCFVESVRNCEDNPRCRCYTELSMSRHARDQRRRMEKNLVCSSLATVQRTA